MILFFAIKLSASSYQCIAGTSSWHLSCNPPGQVTLISQGQGVYTVQALKCTPLVPPCWYIIDIRAFAGSWIQFDIASLTWVRSREEETQPSTFFLTFLIFPHLFLTFLTFSYFFHFFSLFLAFLTFCHLLWPCFSRKVETYPPSQLMYDTYPDREGIW